MLSVAIVEDDQVIRDGVENYLESQEDIFCMISVDSVEKLLKQMEVKGNPEVILMDIGLPGMSGISGMKIFNNRYPDTNIIMFTIHQDSQKIFQSLCAGASGYLIKNTPFSKISEAIRIVAGGGSFMSPQIARKVMDFFHKKQQPADSILTVKEKEIVLGLVDGLSYKMIASQSNISIETVRTHIKNIYKKLHVHCKADVIRKSLSGEI